jgi:hypothetical protein
MLRILGCLSLSVLVGVGILNASPSQTAAGNASPNVSASSQQGRFEGVGSCASTACHGSTEGRIKQGEYSIWMDRDPHQQAYAVLLNDRSQRIIRNLYGAQAVPAQRNDVCLNCHATNPPPDRRGAHFTVAEGVGCESCHGPAGGWRTEHFQPSWKLLSPAEKAARGMRDTKDLVIRAQVCVECHIGSQDRDVNHDLIAAGHPRMDFEYGLFLAKMPKHWYESDEKARHPDFEARVWLIGQAASAKAAVDLLAQRAEGAKENKKPWPEFAEYACFACHHDLREPSPRQKAGYGERQPGSLPWGNWYYSMAGALQDVGAAPGDGGMSALNQLRRLMESPGSDPGKVVEVARSSAREFEASLGQVQAQQYDTARIDQLLRAVVDRAANRPPASWDQAAQEYLAVAALYHGLTDIDPRRRNPVTRQALRAIFNALEVRNPFDSPPQYEPLSIREQMQVIRNRLGP